MKQQFLVDTAETFQTYIYKDNLKIVPTSATLTVYKPGGTTVLINAESMTVGGDGRLSYSLTTTHNDVADENYKSVISYVFETVTYSLTLFYDVVNSKLHKVIADEDIVNELPQLKDQGYRVHGAAESGSSTTIVDSELKRYVDDYFTGGIACSLDKDEEREITDFVSSTGTVTTAAFGSAISTDKYILIRSFTSEIQRAFEKLESWIISKGKRPQLILDPYDLREVHILLSVAEVCKGFITSESSLWWEFMQEYERKALDSFEKLHFKYDTSVDGYISGSEESRRFIKRTGRG
ncbi:MAG: hypothetical protein V3T30_08865 [Thermodesulfobacteriota bacterium]